MAMTILHISKEKVFLHTLGITITTRQHQQQPFLALQNLFTV